VTGLAPATLASWLGWGDGESASVWGKSTGPTPTHDHRPRPLPPVLTWVDPVRTSRSAILSTVQNWEYGAVGSLKINATNICPESVHTQCEVYWCLVGVQFTVNFTL